MIEGQRPNLQFTEEIRHLKIAGIPTTKFEPHRRLQDIGDDIKRSKPTTTALPQGAAGPLPNALHVTSKGEHSHTDATPVKTAIAVDGNRATLPSVSRSNNFQISGSY